MKKKKKKTGLIIIIILMVLALGMCGRACSGSGSGSEEDADTQDTEVVVDEEESDEDAEAEDEDADSGEMSADFKQTMDDYEAWFDHYCEVMKKVQDNPSDLELLSEMTELISEESVMLDEMESMDESEMNSAELAYYLEVTARIEQKLLEVADY